MQKISRTKCSHPAGSNCFICQDKQPFELPEDLYQSFLNCLVVIFAGAGISTENRAVFPYTLYEDVCEELNVLPTEHIAFPDLMSRYCSQPNGRSKLLRKIRDRFDYIRSFPELYRDATRFHRELSTLSVVEEIVTTNWDSYFERECGAIPFVSAEDFTFWDSPGRKVFKIHGSVDSYGSIVATRQDYDLCQQRLTGGLLGSSLRMQLATKTIIYLGFSFRDDDFAQIQEALVSEMKGLAPQSYIVTLDRSSDARFRKVGLLPIYTDATHFIAEVKRRLVSEKQLIDDDRFIGVKTFLYKITGAHVALSGVDARHYPDVVYGLSYQDGMIHALERIIALKNTGHYSHACNVRKMARLYMDRIRPEKMKRRKYHDVAYVDGYVDGLIYFLADDDLRRQMPMYYAYGESKLIRTLKDYRRALGRAERVASRQHKFAKALAHKIRAGDGIAFHHTPFLL